MFSGKWLILFLFLLTPFFGSAQESESDLEFSVMVWNIWHGGKSENIGRDGVEDVIGIIKASEADIILMIETYGSGKRIADALGYNYHLIAKPGTAVDDPAINLSIMSRFPIGERIDFYNYFNIGGLEIQLSEEEKILVFDTWLNYQPWHDQPHLMDLNGEELVAWEKSGTRTKEVGTIIDHLKPFLQNTNEIPVVLGGDFNVWSHLDWTDETKDLHAGKVVPWWTTSQFEIAGLKDSYREINPNPKAAPGLSWGMPDKKDDHRIDYLLYKGKRLNVISSEIHKVDYNKPLKFRGQTFNYPSDHGFVWTKFKLMKQ